MDKYKAIEMLEYSKRFEPFEFGAQKLAVDFAIEYMRGHEDKSEDVQEVIRCKDCVHFCPYEVVEDFDGSCTARGGEADKDDFCNYGKIRGNEDAEIH